MERGRRLDRALGDAAAGAPGPDRGWLQEVTYGTVRLRGRIDHLLARHLRSPLGSLDPPVRGALRLGVYEVLEMHGSPDYAAVSQAVDLATGASGRGAGGLVNAVLRSLLREGTGPEAFPDPDRDPEGHLCHWGSHPRWLVRRWIHRYGMEGTRRLVEANNRRPRIYLRPLGLDPSGALERLQRAGMEAWPGPPDAPVLELASGVAPARALEVAPGIIQDPAAARVSDFVDPPPGSLVADLCAAPGGKSVVLAAGGRGVRVMAGDRSLPRLGLVAANAKRLGLRLPLFAALAERPPLTRADVILLDVPCSGTGTLARSPDARWRLTPDSIRELAAVQRRILDGARPLLSPGGLLVYATCTLEPEENEEQVDAFLERHPELERVPSPGEERNGRGTLRVLPQDSGYDGAYAVRIGRRA